LTRVRLVILDYDLTLVNNVIDFYLAFTESLKKHFQREMSFSEFYDLLVSDKIVDEVPTTGIGYKVWVDMRRLICKSRYISSLAPGLKFFLEITSSTGVEHVIVSGKECHSEYIWRELRRAGIDNFINGVYTFFDLAVLGGYEEELFDKSWLIKYAVKKHGKRVEEAVYIGDYKTDYYSSVKAGVRFIGLAFIERRAELLRDIGVGCIARDFYEALICLTEP